VLAPIFDENAAAWVVLTRRSQHLRTHKGQVSFPGGRQDPGETLIEAALREAREEIALDTRDIEIVGELDHIEMLTSDSSIVPFVGVLPGRPATYTPNPAEVEAVIDVALDELVQDDVFRAELWPMRWSTEDAEVRPMYFFDLYGDTIWGATARMLVNLLSVALGVDH
jgi:8-oxo-dGTP pyrophosphatase MutT (NUDIX family)